MLIVIEDGADELGRSLRHRASRKLLKKYRAISARSTGTLVAESASRPSRPQRGRCRRSGERSGLKFRQERAPCGPPRHHVHAQDDPACMNAGITSLPFMRALRCRLPRSRNENSCPAPKRNHPGEIFRLWFRSIASDNGVRSPLLRSVARALGVALAPGRQPCLDTDHAADQEGAQLAQHTRSAHRRWCRAQRLRALCRARIWMVSTSARRARLVTRA